MLKICKTLILCFSFANTSMPTHLCRLFTTTTLVSQLRTILPNACLWVIINIIDHLWLWHCFGFGYSVYLCTSSLPLDLHHGMICTSHLCVFLFILCCCSGQTNSLSIHARELISRMEVSLFQIVKFVLVFRCYDLFYHCLDLSVYANFFP